MRHPSSAVAFQWDEANEDKLARRGIRPWEVERLWANAPRYVRNKRAGTAVWMMLGRDPHSGRRLKIGILWADERGGILRAIHGLEIERDVGK